MPKPAKLTQPKQTEEEGDFLSDIWGASVQNFVAKSGTGDSTAAPKKIVRIPKAKLPKAVANAIGGQVSDKQIAERLKMLQASQQVVLAGQQLITMFENEQTAAGVTAKAIKAMSDKIESRVTEKLMTVYSQDYSIPDEDDEDKADGSASNLGSQLNGMQTLSQLTELKKKMQSMAAVLGALQHDQCNNMSEILIEAKGAGVTVSLTTHASIFTRIANKFMDEDKFMDWLLLLKSKGPEDQLSIRIAGNGDAQKEFQTRMMCSGLLDILRAKDIHPFCLSSFACVLVRVWRCFGLGCLCLLYSPFRLFNIQMHEG